MKANFTPSQKDYKNITPFKLFVIEQFPFIEANFDAITEWQLLQEIGGKLNEIIKNMYNVTDNTKSLYNSYIALENYVNDYFDNLDVQDEINNKLNEMAQDGTLQEIITSYIETNALLIFNNVNEMKQADNLINGSKCKTLGYYSVNDGGCATYLIRNITNNDVVDNGTLIPLNNENLVAELIVENNTINIKQLGARPQDKQNNKYDITQYLQVYMNFLDKITNRVRLYIPSGVWHCKGFTLSRRNGFDIFGDFGFCIDTVDGTVITSYYDTQDYVLQIGNNITETKNFSFKNIVLSSSEFVYRDDLHCFTYSNIIKNITNQVLNLLYATFGETDNLFFCNINGKALKMASCWELYFKLLNFRKISNRNSSIVSFGEADKTLNANANITACNFEKIMFEAVHGDLFEFDYKCDFGNNHFGVINFEDYKLERDGEIYTTFNDENIQNFDEENAIHYSIFKLNNASSLNATVIDSIEMNNVSYRFYEYNNKKYVYDTILTVEGEYTAYSPIIDNISIIGMNKDMRIMKINPQTFPYVMSSLVINNICNYSKKNFYFDVTNAYDIKCNGKLEGYTSEKLYINDCVPFYKSIYRTSLPAIFSDKNSLNNLNLCVKAFPYNMIKSVITGKNLLVRAKIPNGETCLLGTANINNPSKFYTLEMLGTGEFENYIFDISNIYNIGDIIDWRLSQNNTSTNCLLDFYKFY